MGSMLKLRGVRPPVETCPMDVMRPDEGSIAKQAMEIARGFCRLSHAFTPLSSSSPAASCSRSLRQTKRRNVSFITRSEGSRRSR